MLSEFGCLLTVADVCEVLMCGRNTVYELLGSGSLKGFRIGKSSWRVPKKSLETYIVQKCRQN